eukprot:SAG22_NODE_53_length_24242_cov_158.884231_7_plen_76_part_00
MVEFFSQYNDIVMTKSCLGVDRLTEQVRFDPAVGCDQGGPTTKSGAAWDWYIEGVLEECDSPGARWGWMNGWMEG